MSTRLEILRILEENRNSFISGQELADTLGISRNAVWKAINVLQDQGYSIKSLPRHGYRLIKTEDVLNPDYFKENLKYDCSLDILEETTSTNLMAKMQPDRSKPYVVIADEQTGGRGRLGRTFYSPKGSGLYMSIAFKPDFGLDRAMLITAVTAVVVSRAIENVTGLNPKIKWVNDLYLNGKKLCGILTEAETHIETGNIDRIIVGIGINCYESSLPEEIRETATWLKDAPESFDRNQLACAILNEFFGMLEDFNQVKLIREYRQKSFITGSQILIFDPAAARSIGRPESRLNEGIKARAIDIDDDGGLIVEYLEGRKIRQMETLHTGEITIRKLF